MKLALLRKKLADTSAAGGAGGKGGGRRRGGGYANAGAANYDNVGGMASSLIPKPRDVMTDAEKRRLLAIYGTTAEYAAGLGRTPPDPAEKDTISHDVENLL